MFLKENLTSPFIDQWSSALAKESFEKVCFTYTIHAIGSSEGNITVSHRTFTDQLECMTNHCWPWSDTMTVQFCMYSSRDLMEVHNECENSQVIPY